MCYFGLEPWLNSEINGNKRRLQTTLSVFGRIELRVNLLKLQPTLFALATRRHRVTKFIHFIVFVFVMCVYLHLSLCLYLHFYLCWYLYLRLYLCQSTLFTLARRRHRVTKCVHLIQNSTWSAFTLFQTQFKVCFLSKHSWSVFSFPQSSNTMLNVSVNTQCVFTHSLHSLCVQGLNTFSPSLLSSCLCCYWRR